MTEKITSSDVSNSGDFLWRGGQRIDLEKEADRFTLLLLDPTHLKTLSALPGMQDINPVTDQVFRVKTTATERDAIMAAIRSRGNKAIAHHAYRPKNSEGTIYYLTDKILLRFQAGTSTAEIHDLLQKYALNLIKQYTNQPDTYLVQITDASGANPIKIANRLAEEARVILAEPNLINRFQPAFFPSDRFFQRQWHLNPTTSPQVLPEASIQAPTAWDVTRGDRGIVVAILDDGFDLSHPDLHGQNKIVAAKDYVSGDTNPFPPSTGKSYHGTSCAGLAIAECNSTGVVGVAPGCAFMPVRFPFSAEDDVLIEICEEASKFSDVISCSWGPPPVYAPLSTTLSDTITQVATTGGRRGKGCVICFAASNFNAPVNDPANANGFVWLNTATFQRTTTRGPILNGYAAHPNVIAVAASTSLNQHAAYSNWGKEISVCAPSNNSHPLNPNTFVPGLSIWTTADRGFGSNTTPDGYTGSFGGTSSAAPIVAGVAALVLSANPKLSAAEVKDILQTTADKIVDTSFSLGGANLGVYDVNGHSQWFGYGKVNAEKAVLEAVRRRQ